MNPSGIDKAVSSEINLNTLARSIFKESLEMGFNSNDYVKLMNEILDMTINEKNFNISSTEKNVDDDTQISDLPISTKNLIIREYNIEKDRQSVSKWFEDENNKLFMYSTTTANHLDLDSILIDKNNIFATISLKNEKPIGLLGLINIDMHNKKGEMRKMIGDVEERGKGYAKEASAAWLEYCTNIKGLNKVYINTIETNIKNITLNRQLGLHIEGLLKKDCIIDNVEFDVLRMAYFRKI